MARDNIRHFPPPGWRKHFPELRAADLRAARHRRRVDHWLAGAAASLERIGASPEALRELQALGARLRDELPELPE
jgi:hypothetical protein